MRSGPGVLCWLLLSGSVLTFAQSDSVKPVGSSPAGLEHNFFAIVRNGDALKFLAYIPEDGVNVGRDAQHTTRAEIEDQLTNRKGLYCQLFDSSCIQSSVKLDASAPPCSYRELLTQSEKVRTASTETTRNGVRQAILVAEVHNQKCAGPVLIDFIFNYHQGGWKLFSIP
ncbi:MAG TPA: hypothetical protein VIH91_02710 [Terriglobales bacterium]